MRKNKEASDWPQIIDRRRAERFGSKGDEIIVLKKKRKKDPRLTKVNKGENPKEAPPRMT